MLKTRSLRACLNFALASTTSLSLLALSLQLAVAESPQARRPVLQPDFGPNVLHLRSLDAVCRHPGPDRQGLRHPAAQRVRPRSATPCSSCPANITSTSRSVSTRRCSASAPRPTPSTSPATSTPTPACRTTTPPAPSGARPKAFPSPPTGGTMQWAVSQAVPFRRMHVRGDIVLHQNGGWASGGWMSDTLIDGNVGAGPQQQWISRNSEWGSWTGANWNMVFVGVPASAGRRVAHAALHQDRRDAHRAREAVSRGRCDRATGACAFRRCAPTAPGITWHGGATPGTIDPAQPASTSRTPARTPPRPSTRSWRRARICCSRPASTTSPNRSASPAPNTVVMGLGFATLRPINGTAAMTTADADGIDIAGLLFDAGATISPVLLEVGPTGSHASHATNPICLHDVFFRVGGAGVGRTRSISNQQQRHHRRSHLDLARRSRRRRGLDEQHQRQRPGRQWQQRHHLRALRRTSSAVPGAVERQRAAAPTSTNPKFPTTRPTRPATPARPARTAGPPTKWPTL